MKKRGGASGSQGAESSGEDGKVDIRVRVSFCNDQWQKQDDYS